MSPAMEDKAADDPIDVIGLPHVPPMEYFLRQNAGDRREAMWNESLAKSIRQSVDKHLLKAGFRVIGVPVEDSAYAKHAMGVMIDHNRLAGVVEAVLRKDETARIDVVFGWTGTGTAEDQSGNLFNQSSVNGIPLSILTSNTRLPYEVNYRLTGIFVDEALFSIPFNGTAYGNTERELVNVLKGDFDSFASTFAKRLRKHVDSL